MKKMFAIVLALMLCVSVLSVVAFAAEGDITLHIDAPDAWEECYAYNWPGDALGGWPGTKLSKDSDGLYTVTIKASFDGMVIGAGNEKPQTKDITDLDLTKSEAWIVIGDADSADGKHTYAVSYELGEEPTTPSTTPTTKPESTPDAGYYVAGDNEAVFGASWNPKFDGAKMTKGENGMYSITYKDVPAGKYSFKVTNGTWDKCWGGTVKDGNFEFELTEASDITIEFNSNRNQKQVILNVGDERIEGPITTGDMSLAGVSIALLAATAGLVAVVSKKKEI